MGWGDKKYQKVALCKRAFPPNPCWTSLIFLGCPRSVQTWPLRCWEQGASGRSCLLTCEGAWASGSPSGWLRPLWSAGEEPSFTHLGFWKAGPPRPSWLTLVLPRSCSLAKTMEKVHPDGHSKEGRRWFLVGCCQALGRVPNLHNSC